VLLALLEHLGHGERTAAILSGRLGRTLEPARLLSQTKAEPAAADAVADAWRECLPGDPFPRAHLDFAGLAELRGKGWSVGNHSLTHRPLSALSPAELDAELTGNAGEL